MVGAVRGSPPAAADGGLWVPVQLHPNDVVQPAADALQRSRSSDLFAPFSWDGLLASGPFLRFGYLPGTDIIQDYSAVNGTLGTVLVDSIEVPGFVPTSGPELASATFTIANRDLSIVAHDEPMALLELRTLGSPHDVTIRLPRATTNLRVSQATSWPSSSLSFTNGVGNGRIIVGRGNLTVSGTNVTAFLAASDYLAIRAAPAFAEHATERGAILDAFASGRLAAEFDFVAISGGGWIENSAQYDTVVGPVQRSVGFNSATLQLGLRGSKGGLVLLAFDPMPMPADAGHQITVRANASEIPETADPFASLFSLPGSSDHPAYVRLGMNATVLAVYVPSLGSVSLDIESVAIPTQGFDRPTQLAIVAALFVVALAAAVMFRRPET